MYPTKSLFVISLFPNIIILFSQLKNGERRIFVEFLEKANITLIHNVRNLEIVIFQTQNRSHTCIATEILKQK